MKRISIQLPDKFKWLAMQPWGEWVAFTRKPVIHRAVEHQEGDFVPSYWASQPDELKITHLGKAMNWKKTLRKI